MKKIVFTNNQRLEIVNDYLINKLSCDKIGKKFNVSKRPIIELLKNENVLRKGVSNGKKIVLSETEKDKIKSLYLEQNKNVKEISQILGLTKSFVDKYLSKSNFRRTVGESVTIRQTGTKRTDKVKKLLKKAQQKLSKSGKKRLTGGVCKKYVVHGIECQGTYEKFYIEKLIKENQNLPKNAEPIKTPYGVYYPDFTYSDKLIEIKSDYTYDVLLGNIVSRYSKKLEKKQYKKIEWVNDKIKNIEIIVVDKRNNKLVKKEIK